MAEDSLPWAIFEDEFLLVVAKPAGMVVNRAESVKQATLQDWLETKIDFGLFAESDFKKRSGLVHRLDKDTSGIILAAKTPEVFRELQSQFKKRVVKKTYLALVHGWPKIERGEIDLPIGRNPYNRHKFGIFWPGKKAKTVFEVERRFDKRKERLALLRLHPLTGRTHQLRVHLQHQGWPIVADPIYGGRKNLRRDAAWCPRLFLHAAGIVFNHPVSGKEIGFEMSLPAELGAVLEGLTLV